MAVQFWFGSQAPPAQRPSQGASSSVFLPAGEVVEESIVDLRDLHTIPRDVLDGLIRNGARVARIRTPYREHLAQHFSSTYARIGLPEPYPTAAE